MTKYWFVAKKYGWGWMPYTWEGWAVTLVAILAVIWTSTNTMPEHPLQFGVNLAIIIIGLLFICYKTGEKPYWRWG